MKQVERRIQILIADDHPVIRKMVRSALDRQPRFEVCGEVTDGAQAVQEARKCKPDVVVMNVTMPVLNGFEAAREIIASRPETAIVILSTHADDYFVAEARKIGARAYVAKTKAGDSLVEAIDLAVRGGDFVLMA